MEEIWGEDEDRYVYDAAVNAVSYLNGEDEIESFLYPES